MIEDDGRDKRGYMKKEIPKGLSFMEKI